MQVEDDDGEVVFLKRVAAGAADQSYGIHVAALAGVPGAVVARARELLHELAAASGAAAAVGARGSGNEAEPEPPASVYRQGALFSSHELVGRAVAALDVDATTPLDALRLLARWQCELRGDQR